VAEKQKGYSGKIENNRKDQIIACGAYIGRASIWKVTSSILVVGS